MSDKNVALIDSVLDVQCQAPVEIIPHHVLRRPTESELEQFRAALRTWGVGPFDATMPFEFATTAAGDTITGERSTDPADWKYWVVAVTDGHQGALNEGLHELTEASRLTEVELRFHLQLLNAPGFSEGMSMSGSGSDPGPSRTFRLPKNPLPFDDSLIQTLGHIHERIKSVRVSHPTIYRAIQRYERLSFMEPTNPLYLLGVFAVIEGVLTHDPQGAFDSLGHQIKKKMALLNARFKVPLDCSNFDQIGFDKMWSRLYELRSLVAHGHDAHFTGNMCVLKQFSNVTSFLDQAAKKLLQHALEEPQLIIDLQEC